MRMKPLTRPTRLLGAVALTAALGLAATGCGASGNTDNDSSSSTSPSSTDHNDADHNDADVSFATDMLQHHAQALTMVDLVRGRDLDPEVQALAEQIRDSQAPEIETFSDWLTEWGEPIPETMRDHENGGHGNTTAAESMEGMDDMDMPGMMSVDDMTALEDAPDAEFQTMWLEMMVEHHWGAVEMAETEIEDGQHQPAIDLAEDIVSSQSEEIDAMRDMLG